MDPDCEDDSCSPPVQRFGIEKVIIHEEWDSRRGGFRKGNDIALVRLDGVIELFIVSKGKEMLIMKYLWKKYMFSLVVSHEKFPITSRMTHLILILCQYVCLGKRLIQKSIVLMKIAC